MNLFDEEQEIANEKLTKPGDLQKNPTEEASEEDNIKTEKIKKKPASKAFDSKQNSGEGNAQEGEVKKLKSKPLREKFIESEEKKLPFKVVENFCKNQSTFDSLVGLFENSKLPHSLIFKGNYGADKLSFAFNFILKCIALKLETDSRDIFEKIESGILENILIIKNEKDKKILIDETRVIKDFVSVKSFLDLPKFVIIDSVDFLNINSANCLLKILEEPGDNVFFILLYHNINDILKTIKSRCVVINLKDYSKEEFRKILSSGKDRIDFETEEFKFYENISKNDLERFEFLKEKDVFSDFKNLKRAIEKKDYSAFQNHFGALNEKIKMSDKNFGVKSILPDVFINIFIEIYKNRDPNEYIDKYKDYIKFIEKIRDDNTNVLNYFNIIR